MSTTEKSVLHPTNAPNLNDNSVRYDEITDWYMNVFQSDRNPKSLIDYIGEGYSRCVYNLTKEQNFGIENYENYVLKAETYMKDSKSNRLEVKAWDKLPEHISERFCVPIRAASPEYHWVLMDKANIDAPSSVDRNSLKKSLEDEYNARYGDLAVRNIGKHDGQMKIVDYGGTWEHRDEKILR